MANPVFIVGLIEYISNSVSVGTRPTASLLTGQVDWWLTSYNLDHLH